MSRWLRSSDRDPGAALVRAATDAIARPESLDAPTLRRRLADLAAAAEEGDGARFVPALVDAAPALMGYLLSFELDGSPPGLLRTYSADAFGRFLNTLELTQLPLTGPILEIGANPYLFHLLLRAVFPKAALVGSNFFDHDIFSTHIGSAQHCLRSSSLGEVLDFDFPTFNLETVHPYPYPAGSLDVVFFCETLEHLVVNPLRVFREIRRILSPGGHLVLTLPNALRLTNVAAMLAGRNFFDLYQVGNGVHGRHNREFSLAEVRTLLERDWFEIVRAETRDRFDYDTVPIEAVDYSGPAATLPFGKADLERWIRRAGGSTTDRGDNIYVVARRPASAHPIRSADPGPSEAANNAPLSHFDNERLISFLDVLEETAEGLRVTGWAFYTDDASGAPADVEIVLRGQDRSTIHRAEGMPRADVASAHGLEHDMVGFTTVVPRSELPSSRLEVRLRLRSSYGVTAERRLGEWEGAARQGPNGAEAGETSDAS
ncbi:MAG: methyltransferase domain-containing protein [Deltaproteobacteria bacterium]|nr:methyltransferase domain-containing protein [Deltaproteobacteria bacterium]